ncbi:DUF2812 domain-containing protein [Marinilactibacillus kalidii]|uniref:DUF2812 domain-containing protein n=1 Tax=Marinilactibacillus kalidii TaxID=2820274 RepID=UPI001ABDE6F4|nr:DUF2812 domain-containing protein [Marinilactibacillus kalidii]
MSKTVIKLRPTNYYNIGQYESWLYDMSLKGLHLKRLNLLTATFEKSEPEKMRYRLDFNKSSRELGEQVSLYGQNGWIHITTFGECSIYASPEDSKIPELHTDTVEQANSLKKHVVQLGLLAMGSLLLVLFIGYHSFQSLISNQFMLSEREKWGELLFQLMYMSISIGFIRDWYTLWSIRKRLLTGEAIDHHVPWKASFYIRNIYNVVILIICLSFIIITIFNLLNNLNCQYKLDKYDPSI